MRFEEPVTQYQVPTGLISICGNGAAVLRIVGLDPCNIYPFGLLMKRDDKREYMWGTFESIG